MSRSSFYRELPVSSHWDEKRVAGYSRQQKGKIGEAAVSFRCVLHGCALFVSPFDGDKADRVIETPAGRILKLQIRWCKHRRSGSPTVRLTSVGNNRVTRRAKKGDFDFLVGYDLRTDNAFVFSWEETKDIGSEIAVTEESMEAWHKLQ